MGTQPVSPVYRFVRVIGSLWFAAVLLVVLLVAMACATVFESMHSTERALHEFYKSDWFVALLGLLAVNVFAAMVVRFPFSRRQIGFVMTHTSILVIFAGALMTFYLAEDGSVALVEGQSTDQFVLRDRDTLAVMNRLTQARSDMDLNARGIGGFGVVDQPGLPPTAVDGIQIAVERYVPDSRVVEQMKNDNPFPRPAVQLAVSKTGLDDPQWIFPNQRTTIAAVGVSVRVAQSADELRQLLDPNVTAEASGKGRVKIVYEGTVVDRPVDECMALPVALGDTGMSFRVLRYMPHATVGGDNKITNASNEPINPAVEVEIAGPEGTATRIAFAKFPDFSSMHGAQELADVKVTHVREAGGVPPATPLEIVRGPAGELHVRFTDGRGGIQTQPLTLGQPVDTPWQGKRVAVLQSFEHARFDQSLEPLDTPRKTRIPGLLVRLTTDASSDTIWLQKHKPMQLTVDGKPFELMYSTKQVPLGFTLKLDAFRVGYYPGTQRPRSFESRVTVVDPTKAGETSQFISMNKPGRYGKYTLFQSSYDMRGGRTMSVLSVSNDPGQIVVFAGYFLMMGGMLVVISTRAKQTRQAQHIAVSGGGARGTNGQVKVDLLHADERCSGGMPAPQWQTPEPAQSRARNTGVKQP